MKNNPIDPIFVFIMGAMGETTAVIDRTKVLTEHAQNMKWSFEETIEAAFVLLATLGDSTPEMRTRCQQRAGELIVTLKKNVTATPKGTSS